VNTFLVQMPHQLVLVDTGAGTGAGDAAGNLPARLKAAGVDPAQVDLIFITHFHMDHVGGLLKPDGTRAFPNAVVRMSQAENDFWTGDPERIPERNRKGLPAIKAIVTAYTAAGKYRPFAPGEALGEGIRALATVGHTPGHSCYAFSSEGRELWCLGDLIHFGAIQFAHPGVAWPSIRIPPWPSPPARTCSSAPPRPRRWSPGPTWPSRAYSRSRPKGKATPPFL